VLKTELAYIHENFSSLSQSITEIISTKNLLALKRKKSVSDIQDELNGSEGDVIKQKFISYFNKNEGFKVMCEISCLSEGEDLVESEDVKDLSLGDIVCYKCARLVSCNVEQTLSVIRSLFHVI
jgi:hypothetical protein